MRLLENPETIVVSRKPIQLVMDHSEGKEGTRSALPPQQQDQSNQHQSQQPQNPQQLQWSQGGGGQPLYQQLAQQPQSQPQQHQRYPPHQQQPPPPSSARRTYPTGPGPTSEIPPNMPAGGGAAAMMPRRPQEVDYHSQGTGPGPSMYPMHAQQSAAHYAAAGYQRQYQAHPQMYHHQHQHQPPPPMAVQHSQYAPTQQPRMGMPPSHMEHPHAPPPQHQQPYIQPKVGRLPADRPLIKLSVSLIDTYKHINTVYYEERDARRAARAKEKQKGQGTHNHGWDDENYDYIITSGELFYGRYRIKERIGKGSFGQVVRAEDVETRKDVAIKIIKSKKPFLIQAKTEIELLTHLNQKDPDDQHNIVRLLTHFMYRNHQCLVFEMLSLNLYELLKNTQFGGVSLQLIRKFAKQVLRALSFLAQRDVDIIHCDLKPENILLRHPKKSGVKVIDFGSSCKSNKRMYSYIQSRFYRSPEVMLGLPYSVAIDMWSLGCILAEMHTGEPLFSGSDQFDQMQKIVKLLGMVPMRMLEQSSDQHRLQFFERIPSTHTGRDEWTIKQSGSSSTSRSTSQPKQIIIPSTDPVASLTEVISADTQRKKKFPPSEARNTAHNYDLFIDLIYRMLAYDPAERIKPDDALNHPFITAGDPPPQHSPYAPSSRR